MSLSAGRVQIPEEDRSRLLAWTRSSSVRAGLARRARIVLAAGEGAGTSEIAASLGVSRPTVIAWRERYRTGGLAALDDAPRSGRPVEIEEAEIVARTLEPPPERLGVTHWSTRLLAKEAGVSDFTIAKTWRRWGLQPWRRETFKFSTDPELVAKVRDVIGLYLHPPEKAIVLCVDEKSQIQALDRTAPILPIRPGLPEKATHDYVRHGTTTLFAALEVATGKVTDACYDRHRHEEFLDFLKKVARAYPRRELHIVLDNYGTHKHPDVEAWLEKHPRITLHFTPTSGSWLNLVEVFFGIITRQAIRRGTFTSVKDLVSAIRRFIDGWNDRCHPFVWTKTPDEVLSHAHRSQGTSNARH
ncbi:MAG: IS630 family transposase [Actinomycetota bacterium]